MKPSQALLGGLLLLLCDGTFAKPFIPQAFMNLQGFVANRTNLANIFRVPQGGLWSFLREITSDNRVDPSGPPGETIMTSQKNQRKEAIEDSANIKDLPNPLSENIAKLFELELPQMSDVALERTSGLGGMAGLTALSVLALGALLASPAPSALRRKDDEKETSFLDLLSNFWNDDGADKYPHTASRRPPPPNKVYHIYPQKGRRPPKPHYGRPESDFAPNKYPHDIRGYKTKEPDYYYEDYESEPYQPSDSPFKFSESKLKPIKSVYPKEKKESLWPFSKEKAPEYDPNGLVKRSNEPHVYVTVEEVNRLADESLRDILQHYENTANRRSDDWNINPENWHPPKVDNWQLNGKQAKPTKNEISASKQVSYMRPDSSEWKPVHQFGETDWYPISDPDPRLKNHKLSTTKLQARSYKRPDSSIKATPLVQEKKATKKASSNLSHLEKEKKEFQRKFQIKYSKDGKEKTETKAKGKEIFPYEYL